MLSVVKHDCRSTTGRNLRNIMILVGKSNVEDISKDDLRSQYYHAVPKGEEWKISLAEELFQVKNHGHLEIESIDATEAGEILEYILT